MNEIIIGIVLAVVVFIIIKIKSGFSSNIRYNYSHDGNRDPSRKKRFSLISPRFDEEAIVWCANLLGVEKSKFKKIVNNTGSYYTSFSLRKRRGGYRTIHAPRKEMLAIQKNIYYRILLSVHVHPAATGFRKRISLTENVKPHLGKNDILKIDIADFFGSIKKQKVIKVFEKTGYPKNIAKVLAEICCISHRIPQGAVTSPALSNIIAYEMDQELTVLSNRHGLTYTRYADDLTFSGHTVEPEVLLPAITQILGKYRFMLQHTKTRFLTKQKRKIITGISISSGMKMTVPKTKKRELRKNIYFILTKGLEEHQRFIGSNDPAYLKRILGYLYFWLSVEPENQYVKKSVRALERLK